jgi:steroid 5-alpha reductase family enzyme
MLGSIVTALIISLAINLLMFFIAFRLNSDKLTDASYAISFIALAVFVLIKSSSINNYVLLGSLMVIIWAIRIGGFLLYRVIKAGKDKRFDEIRDSFINFGKFWLGQALTVWILTLPLITSAKSTKPLGLLSIIGILVWLVGLLIEAAADNQKRIFKNKSKTIHEWIDEGLWHYSRHPNYFGEILVWFGIYIYSFNHLDSLGKLIGLVSPVFIFLLLRFISGIPILEKSADKKWGKDPAYKTYKKQTNLLIPIRN